MFYIDSLISNIESVLKCHRHVCDHMMWFHVLTTRSLFRSSSREAPALRPASGLPFPSPFQGPCTMEAPRLHFADRPPTLPAAVPSWVLTENSRPLVSVSRCESPLSDGTLPRKVEGTQHVPLGSPGARGAEESPRRPALPHRPHQPHHSRVAVPRGVQKCGWGGCTPRASLCGTLRD